MTDFDLFRPDGHLTGRGLAALAACKLDELERLEAAEHLAFCDACLMRQMALLGDEALMEAPPQLKAGAVRKLRRRRLRIAWGRYATVAAAAVLAVAIWGVGSVALFRGGGEGKSAAQQAPLQGAAQQAGREGPGFGARISQGLDNMFAGFDDFWAPFRFSAAPAGNQAEDDQAEGDKAADDAAGRDGSVREEKEKLFDKAAGGEDSGGAGKADSRPEDGEDG